MSATHSSKKSASTRTGAATSPHASPSAPIAEPGPPPPASPSPPFVVEPPPADTPTFQVPAGFVPIDITYYRGVLPKGAQLAVLAGAVNELKDFPDYAAVFGKTAPPYAAVVNTFDVAQLWSSLRTRLDAYDVYCSTQEALAWKEVHDYMGRMQPAFELAVKSDSTIGSERPSLVRLFGAQKEISKKAVATRKANAQLKAEGKLPAKGKVGKRRKRAAANALLEAATNAGNAGTQTAAPAPSTSPAANTPNGSNGAPHT